MAGGTDKFKKSSHYCSTPVFAKRAGKVWSCRKCGAVYTCKLVKGRLTWLMTRDGRK
jgi:ribosomal protein L37AE/L43A